MKHRLSTETKLTIQFWLGVVVIITGIVLLFLGFYAVPLGEIADSILVAFGEVATFSGALIGIDYSYKYRTYKLDKQEEYRKNKLFYGKQYADDEDEEREDE